MSYDVSHIMLDGKVIKAEIRQSDTPLLAFCDFEDGRSARIINIGGITYKYIFEDGEEMTFRSSGLNREQISN